MSQQTDPSSPAIEAALPPVMADLSHIVHNASNLVLGHLAAIQRTQGKDDRLDERARVIETALGRITDVVNALRGAVDAEFWGPPEPRLLDEALAEALRLIDKEATRRRIRLLHIPLDLSSTPEIWLDDGNRVSALLSALIGSEVERLGSGGSLTVVCTPTSLRSGELGSGSLGSTHRFGHPDHMRIDIEVRRDDELPLYRGGDPSVWYWIAERFADEVGATIEQDVAAHTSSVVLPVSGAPLRR